MSTVTTSKTDQKLRSMQKTIESQGFATLAPKINGKSGSIRAIIIYERSLAAAELRPLEKPIENRVQQAFELEGKESVLLDREPQLKRIANALVEQNNMRVVKERKDKILFTPDNYSTSIYRFTIFLEENSESKEPLSQWLRVTGL